MERGAQEDVVTRSIALDCLERTLPPIDEDQKLALLYAPFKGTTLLEGSWLSYRKRTRSVLQPSPCSLSQQRPLHPTLHVLTSDEVRALRIRRALRDLADVAEDRAGPRPSATITRPGQSKDGQKALTVSVSTDSKKRKVESQDDASQTP